MFVHNGQNYETISQIEHKLQQELQCLMYYSSDEI